VSAPAALALTRATRQCLANVARHAGVDAAELVVYGSPGEVTIMVVDDGRGFVVDATPRDRLGLRHSVIERIEAVGGRAQLFSAPGRGTSVLLTVPSREVVA
jgi:signal transduction histidine kinase